MVCQHISQYMCAASSDRKPCSHHGGLPQEPLSCEVEVALVILLLKHIQLGKAEMLPQLQCTRARVTCYAEHYGPLNVTPSLWDCMASAVAAVVFKELVWF
jgi:hypothetical protein